MRLVAFCEAPGDFRLVVGLVDRVFRELGPSWVADNFESPDVIRTWQPDGFGNAYFDIHDLNRYMDRLRTRGIRGHFNGRPGDPGAAMVRKAFVIARALSKQTPDDPIDAVVVVWDMDSQGDQRRAGVEAARDDVRRWLPAVSFEVVCGFPDPEREAWVLAGFEPCDDSERDCLSKLERGLGFSPVLHAGRLRDPSDGADRSLKRVLRLLIRDDASREERCWTEPPLDTLRARGTHTGLAAFLEEIETILLPLLDGSVAGRRTPMTQ